MKARRLRIPVILSISLVVLAVAGLVGWLLPEFLGVEAGGEAPAAGGVSGAVTGIGIGAVIVAAFLVTITGRRLLARVSGSDDRTALGRSEWSRHSASGGAGSADMLGTRVSSGGAPAGELTMRLQGEVARAERYGHALSLLAVGVDEPDLLETVEAVVRNSVRVSDACVRTGANRIMVILVETDSSGAARAAEKLRRGVEVYPFDRVEPVAVSIGVASFAKGQTVTDLLSHAHEACERAGVAGGNRVIVEDAQES